MSKPGFMVYFADCDLMEELEDSEFRQLFRAMRDFAETGTVPDFENRFIRIAWKSVVQGLQRDDARYSDAVMNSRYAVYCREEKRAGREPLSMDDWKMSPDIGRQRSITDDNEQDQNYPTTTTAATPTSIPNASPTTAAAADTPMTETASTLLQEYGIAEDAELTKAIYGDLIKHGEAIVREALSRAKKEDTFGGITARFYVRYLFKVLNEQKQKPSPARAGYMTRDYSANDYSGLTIDLDTMDEHGRLPGEPGYSGVA